jgi:hypothetical protein
MAQMPGYFVSKGPFAYLDDRFDGTTPTNYSQALAAIGSGLLQAAQARFPGAANPSNAALVDHFDKDWLALPPSLKKLCPNDVLTAALTEVIEKAYAPYDVAHNANDPDALSKLKRIEFFWVCADEDSFHVYHSEGPHQVTVIVFTPPPEQLHGNPPTLKRDRIAESSLALDEPENLWVMKVEDEYEGWKPGKAPRDPDPYPGGFQSLGPTTCDPDRGVIKRQLYRERSYPAP